jgi:serine/threonine-protein kinase RsbW
VDDILLAVDEAATNIIVHGYRGQPGDIEIEVENQDGSLAVSLRDKAPPFDPTRVPMPDLSLPLDQRPFGGMGVHLMRQCMDDVIYRAPPQGGNELILVKKRIQQAADKVGCAWRQAVVNNYFEGETNAIQR